MRQNIFLIQSIFVVLTVAQQRSTDAVVSWPFYSSPVSNSNPVPFPTCLLWSQSVNRRDDYTYVPGIGSYKLHTRPVLWNEARVTCVEEGGHLAIINSIAEADAVLEIFNNSEPIFGSSHSNYISIGFHDFFHEGEFTTVHDQTLAKAGFTRWATGQPDNDGTGENCGVFTKGGLLNDINCNSRLAFICEHSIYRF